jgi:hypothetical protein
MDVFLKIFVVSTMLIALHLLYRIAYPKQPKTKVGYDVSDKEPNPVQTVMGKSRFVLPDRSQPPQTPAISTIAEQNDKKAFMFAAENQEKRSGVLSSDVVAEIFDEPNPDELEIEPDDEDKNEIDLAAEEETEAINRSAGIAEGVDFDDLQHVAKIVKEQPETVSDETAVKVDALEHTDVIEALVSSDEGKKAWIQAILDRNVQSILPETDSKIQNTDNGNMDVAGFLRLNNNKRKTG